MRLPIATALAVAALGAVAAQAAAPPPGLSITATRPLTIRGLHFPAREWIHVTVAATSSHTARRWVNAAGSFTAIFPNLAFGPCAGVLVKAVGARGTVARLKIPQRACMPAKNP